MDENRQEKTAPTLTLEDFENIGRAWGMIVSAFRRGYEAGTESYFRTCEKAVVTETITNEDDPSDAELDIEIINAANASKVNLEDCKACWCNTCARIENCVYAPIKFIFTGKPYPCASCFDGIQYERIIEGEQCDCQGYVKGEENNE